MPEPVIFKDLPATFPEKDKYKKPSVIGSIVFHGLLIFVVIIVPLLMPQTIPERELIVTLVSPIGPPPPPPPPPVEIPVITAPKAVQPQVRSVAPDALIAPVALPKEVVKIVEEPIVPAVGENTAKDASGYTAGTSTAAASSTGRCSDGTNTYRRSCKRAASHQNGSTRVSAAGCKSSSERVGCSRSDAHSTGQRRANPRHLRPSIAHRRGGRMREAMAI